MEPYELSGTKKNLIVYKFQLYRLPSKVQSKTDHVVGTFLGV